MVSVKHWAQRGIRQAKRSARSYGSSIIAGYLGSRTKSTYSKRTGSSTSTMRNKKFRNDTAAEHSEVTSKYLSSTLGHPYNKKCIGSSVLRYGEITQFFGETSTGIQNCETILTACSVSQMAVGNAETAPAVVAVDTGGVGLLDMNPNQKNSGSAYLTAGAVPRDDQLFLSNCKLIIDVVNLSTVGCVLDLYMVTPTAHTNLTPTTVWANGLASDASGQSTATAPAAFVTSAQVGVPVIQSPIATPETCNHFKKMYKIIGKYSTNLAGGASETINWNVNTNYTIDLNRMKVANNFTNMATALTNANIVTNYMRFGTFHIMAVYRGTAVLNVQTDTAPDPDVPYPFCTYSKVKLGFVFQKKYTMKMIAGNASRLSVQTAGQFIPINVGVNKQVDTEDVPGSVEVVT